MRAQLLWWAGCPSTERARELLAEGLAANGLDPGTIEMCEVSTGEEAASQRFVGSPTIRVGGVEVAPEPDEPVGLTCRVYRTRDGRVSPVPDPSDIDDAIKEALDEHR